MLVSQQSIRNTNGCKIENPTKPGGSKNHKGNAEGDPNIPRCSNTTPNCQSESNPSSNTQPKGVYGVENNNFENSTQIAPTQLNSTQIVSTQHNQSSNHTETGGDGFTLVSSKRNKKKQPQLCQEEFPNLPNRNSAQPRNFAKPKVESQPIIGAKSEMSMFPTPLVTPCPQPRLSPQHPTGQALAVVSPHLSREIIKSVSGNEQNTQLEEEIITTASREKLHSVSTKSEGEIITTVLEENVDSFSHQNNLILNSELYTEYTRHQMLPVEVWDLPQVAVTATVVMGSAQMV